MPVYDDEQQKTGVSDDELRHITGISPDEESAMDREAQNGASEDVPDKQSLSPAELAGAEASAGQGNTSDTTPENEEKNSLPDDDSIPFRDEGGKRFFRLSRNKKIGLVAGGTAITSLVALFSFLSPVMKLESFLTGINQRVFGFASNAVEGRIEHLAERYVVAHVINLNNCTAVSSVDCKKNYASEGIAGSLFNQWRDARVEEKLFDQMGFQVVSTNNPESKAGVHKFTLRDRNGGLITFSDIDDWDRFKSGQFTGGSREFGRKLRFAINEEIPWYHVMQRKSVRNYLQRKHGIRLWCFFACSNRDNLEIKTADAKTRYKYRFVERFVYPFSGKYGLILDCLISGEPGKGKCSAEGVRERGISRDRLPDADIDNIVKDLVDSPGSERLSQVVIRRLLTKVMGQQSARTATAAIPIAGQIYLGVVMVDMFDRLDNFIDNNGLSQYAGDVALNQYREYYTTMRSFNDELKNGEAGLDEVGAVMSDLNEAEKSLVYQKNNADSFKGVSLFGERTYAQEANNDDSYVCDNGNPIPAGELVCEEKKIGRTYAIEEMRDNRVVDGLATALNTYGRCTGFQVPGTGTCAGIRPRTIVRPVLQGIDSITTTALEPLISGAMSALSAIPLLGDFMDYLQEKSQELVMAVFTRVIPLPINVDDPAREKYDGLEAGGEATAMEFGQGGYTESGEGYGLGGRLLTDEESAKIMSDYYEQQDYNFKNKSLFARIADRDDPKSLVSNLIRTAPSNNSQLASTLQNGLPKFFGNLGNMLFGSLLGNNLARANTTTSSSSPFNIPRFGYTASDADITRDPALLTDEFCEQAKALREQSAVVNPTTGITEYSVTDPCLLERVVVEAAGGYYTND